MQGANSFFVAVQLTSAGTGSPIRSKSFASKFVTIIIIPYGIIAYGIIAEYNISEEGRLRKFL